MRRAPVTEIGKTRWEMPYLEPDADGWRKHRETLDAHLPFRDFEIARPDDPTAASATCPSLGCRYSTSRDVLSATAVWATTSPSARRRKRALRRSEAYLAEAQRLSQSGAFAFNARQGPVYWSEGMLPNLGGLIRCRVFPTAKLGCNGFIRTIADRSRRSSRRHFARKARLHGRVQTRSSRMAPSSISRIDRPSLATPRMENSLRWSARPST